MDNFFYSDNLDPNASDDDEAGYYSTFAGHDSVIIAVDCCEEMFDANVTEDGACGFEKTCEAVKDMFRNKIICSERDLQGFVCFGTQESKNQPDFKHIYTVQDLDSPSASRIKELQELQDSSLEEFSKKYGHCNKHQVSELLWCCSSMFSRSQVTLSSKTVVIFTWDDNPHQGDRNAHLRARTKAKDLMEQDITIQVLSFNKDFKYEKFYKDIISDPDVEDNITLNPIDGIKNLYEFLLRKCTKKRTLAKIPFKLCDGLEMSVGVYTVARRATKGANVNIDSKTNQMVQTKTNFVHNDTGDILMQSDINLMQKWGDRNIVFENDEVQDMRRCANPGMILLGFKPREKAIKAWHHIRPAQFIYPDEKSVKGSTTLFSALLTKCTARDVVAICSFAPRSNSAERCVALVPQSEDVDESTGEQLKSPGFFVIFLPFSEDLRNIEVEETTPPGDDQVKAAEAIIRKLRFTYRPSNFDNPALQKHYRNLEAMALDKDEPDEITDFTLPNNDKIGKKAGPLITAFKELVFPEGYDPMSKGKPKPTKRKLDGADAGDERKRSDVGAIDVKEYAMNRKLAKLTVPVLKELCKNNGISATGKKKDLIEALEQAFFIIQSY